MIQSSNRQVLGVGTRHGVLDEPQAPSPVAAALVTKGNAWKTRSRWVCRTETEVHLSARCRFFFGVVSGVLARSPVYKDAMSVEQSGFGPCSTATEVEKQEPSWGRVGGQRQVVEIKRTRPAYRAADWPAGSAPAPGSEHRARYRFIGRRQLGLNISARRWQCAAAGS